MSPHEDGERQANADDERYERGGVGPTRASGNRLLSVVLRNIGGPDTGAGAEDARAGGVALRVTMQEQSAGETYGKERGRDQDAQPHGVPSLNAAQLQRFQTFSPLSVASTASTRSALPVGRSRTNVRQRSMSASAT